MKQIGYTDGGNGWSRTHTGPIPADQLFIPEPGTRENIDAEVFKHVGWVIPGDIRTTGGKIYDTHALSGDEGRPAYIRRRIDGPIRSMETVQIGSRNHEVADASARTVTGLGPDDPMDVRRSELDALTNRVTALENIVRPDLVKRGVLSEGAAAKGFANAPAVEPAMTFYDHAFIHAAINHRHYYGDEGITAKLIEDAHHIASHLTRNRANQP